MRAHLKRPGPGGRFAFTLIEMLLVIAIIATLASLLLVAVFQATKFGGGVQASNDIAQFDVALQSFKTTYGFYPPSRIRLCKRQADYNYWKDSGAGGSNRMYPLEADSIFYISKLAARITDSTPAANAGTPPIPAGRTKSPWMSTTPKTDPNYDTTGKLDYINWDNDQTNSYDPAATPPWSVVLEGDQCLVFFLGGMSSSSGGQLSCTGFSKNPTNPALPAASPSEDRQKFYDFNSSRLVSFSHSGVVGPNSPKFLSFLDQQGVQPLLYFSSYKSTNGYNRFFFPVKPAWVTGSGPTFSSLQWSDCHTVGVWPYSQPNLTYQNSETYQVLSAGPDKKFGAGTAKNVTTMAYSSGANQTIHLVAVPAFANGQAVVLDVENPTNTETVIVSNVDYTNKTFVASLNRSHTTTSAGGPETAFSVTGPFWTKATAQDVYPTGAPGADDISNFSERALGVTLVQ